MAQQRNLAARRRDGFRHAMHLIGDICEIAGAPTLIDDARVELARAGVIQAIQRHDNAVLFDWLMEALSYQGVSDAAAAGYMERHGRAGFDQIAQSLRKPPSCSKLTSWWHFENCGYRKAAFSCNELELLPACPLPSLDLRNGSLNRAAYGLFLFIRDVAGGDLVRWIDRRLDGAKHSDTARAGTTMAESVIGPLRHVHGLSDKVLSMTFSVLLLAGDPNRKDWITAGTSMIAIDTLVHNWLARTGILRRLDSEHLYGPGCYGDDGCAAIVMHAAQRIDASRFNPEFPRVFPRFVQHAIWHFCAQWGLARCNGLTVRDGTRCRQRDCEAFARCDRVKQPRSGAT
jgi:hypothetical protein